MNIYEPNCWNNETRTGTTTNIYNPKKFAMGLVSSRRPRTFLIILSLLGLIMAFASASAEERSILVFTAFWQDDSGQATYQDVLTAEFQPFEGALTRGYSSSAMWLKLRISGQQDTEPLALVVRPAFLGNIMLYLPSDGKNEAPQALFSGRNATVEAGNHIGIDNGFVIPPSADDRDIFLRVTTTTTLTIDVSVNRLSYAERQAQGYTGFVGLYLAFILAFCLWALVSWAVRREAIYGLFALRQAYAAMHIFIWFGLFRLYFSDALAPTVRDFIYCLVIVTIVPVSGFFDSRLFADFGVSIFLRKIFHILIAASLTSSLLLLFSGYSQAALQTNASFATILMPFTLLLALSVSNKEKKAYGQLAVWVIRGGYTLITLMVFVSTLMFKNVINVSMPILNILFAHAVISTMVLFSILSIRERQRDLMAQDALLQYELKARELDRENIRRREKERFLSMLIHELRNPLTVIRLKANSGSGDQAVQRAAIDIEKVIERVEQSEKVDDEKINPQRTSIDVTKLVEEIVQEHSLGSRVTVDSTFKPRIGTDEGVLASIFRNLLDNAEKYSPAGSLIQINLSSASINGSKGVKIAVTNEVGKVGLPDPERLFQKYYRARGAQSQAGSGLGLFLVAGWAKALGGSIRCDHHYHSDGRNFICFSLWLPA